MQSTIESLYLAALALPTDQRAELTERLRASLGSPGASQLEEDFHKLAEQWRKETQLQSSISKKFQHPAYLQIIALGEPAIPLILRELRDQPGLWFEALKRITGQTPVPAHESANPRLAREEWLRWGKEKGYLE